MINIKFRAEEQLLDDLQLEFNKLAEIHYPDILQWNHFELWQKSGKMFSPEDWKKFRLNDKVDEWYNEELILIAKQKAFQLLSTAGNNKSVGESQALNQVTSFLERNKDNSPNEVYMIYGFIPLNKEEEKAKNVRIIENIPIEIQNAIKKYTGNKPT